MTINATGNSQRCSRATPASRLVGRFFHHCRNRSRVSAGSRRLDEKRALSDSEGRLRVMPMMPGSCRRQALKFLTRSASSVVQPCPARGTNWRSSSQMTQPDRGASLGGYCVPQAQGNALWDCISLIDDATVTLINGLGGLKAIAVSHPHFYTTMAEWSRAFGSVPVHIHADDQRWIMRADPCIKLWQGETLTLLPT